MDEQELANLAARISDPRSWQTATGNWPGQVAPTIERNGYTRLPLPGYIGKHYSKSRVVFLGTNPGPGKGANGRFDRDEPLFKTLLPQLMKRPVVDHFVALNDYLATAMPTWDIFRNIDFPICFGLKIEELAYSNVLLANTPDGVRPHEVDDGLFKFSIDCFLAEWLEVADPRLIVVLGKKAALLLERYWTPAPTTAIISMGLPTRQVMNTHRESFERDFESAKVAICRVFPTAKKRLGR